MDYFEQQSARRVKAYRQRGIPPKDKWIRFIETGSSAARTIKWMSDDPWPWGVCWFKALPELSVWLTGDHRHDPHY